MTTNAMKTILFKNMPTYTYNGPHAGLALIIPIVLSMAMFAFEFGELSGSGWTMTLIQYKYTVVASLFAVLAGLFFGVHALNFVIKNTTDGQVEFSKTFTHNTALFTLFALVMVFACNAVASVFILSPELGVGVITGVLTYHVLMLSLRGAYRLCKVLKTKRKLKNYAGRIRTMDRVHYEHIHEFNKLVSLGVHLSDKAASHDKPKILPVHEVIETQGDGERLAFLYNRSNDMVDAIYSHKVK